MRKRTISAAMNTLNLSVTVINAISDYNQALWLNSSYAEAYYHQGLAYRAQGYETLAQADFDKAKQLGYTGPQWTIGSHLNLQFSTDQKLKVEM
jgi:tetratricopeptide (TPR) repeat protein